MATDAERRHMQDLMRFLIAHEPNVHYAMRRPMETVKLTEKQMRAKVQAGRFPGITMDCSESVTCLCKWAGLSDPNGERYNGTGWTGTLLAHLPHYSDPKIAEPGALVVFGPGSGDHVCMVLESGTDPLLFSHGQERGPLAIRLSVERRAHRTPVTFLNISKL